MQSSSAIPILIAAVVATLSAQESDVFEVAVLKALPARHPL